MVVAEISVLPLGTGSPSLSDYVAKAVEVLRKRGLKYQVTAMGTLVEGELGEILEAVREMHEAVLEAGAQRVITTLKVDERRDKPLSLEGKVEAVRKRLEEGRT
ncbi:MAG: thiamine-binding protein [Hadesarchaea archaeon]|nr:MAG: thiamine-binding protein [Hadesarchaea archaeon]TDA34225.1 MAG: thiamine-binding protein [Hadesarchaea archaeon]